tara:strand:- start:8 stop:511 length:504 start_codon:yes stop_codon:yes gene_type:complete
MSTLITTTAQIGTIKDAGGNATAMTIDNAGRILTPARPSFKASPTGSGNQGATNDIIFGDVTTATLGLHNIGGHYSTSTGKFTAPVTGVYVFHFCTGQYSSNVCIIKFYKNTNQCGTMIQNTGDTSDTLEASQNLHLSANDFVHMKVTGGSYEYGADASFFSGYLLG